MDVELHRRTNNIGGDFMKRKQDNEAEKITLGNITVCEECGRKIPKERLKAVPNTTFCVHCAAKSENEGDTERVIPLVDYDPSELLDAISSDD